MSESHPWSISLFDESSFLCKAVLIWPVVRSGLSRKIGWIRFGKVLSCHLGTAGRWYCSSLPVAGIGRIARAISLCHICYPIGGRLT